MDVTHRKRHRFRGSLRLLSSVRLRRSGYVIGRFRPPPGCNLAVGGHSAAPCTRCIRRRDTGPGGDRSRGPLKRLSLRPTVWAAGCWSLAGKKDGSYGESCVGEYLSQRGSEKPFVRSLHHAAPSPGGGKQKEDTGESPSWRQQGMQDNGMIAGIQEVGPRLQARIFPRVSPMCLFQKRMDQSEVRHEHPERALGNSVLEQPQPHGKACDAREKEIGSRSRQTIENCPLSERACIPSLDRPFQATFGNEENLYVICQQCYPPRANAAPKYHRGQIRCKQSPSRYGSVRCRSHAGGSRGQKRSQEQDHIPGKGFRSGEALVQDRLALGSPLDGCPDVIAVQILGIANKQLPVCHDRVCPAWS